MKNSTQKVTKKEEKATIIHKPDTDEMAEMESFIRKKRLQNQILKKATQK